MHEPAIELPARPPGRAASVDAIRCVGSPRRAPVLRLHGDHCRPRSRRLVPLRPSPARARRSPAARLGVARPARLALGGLPTRLRRARAPRSRRRSECSRWKARASRSRTLARSVRGARTGPASCSSRSDSCCSGSPPRCPGARGSLAGSATSVAARSRRDARGAYVLLVCRSRWRSSRRTALARPSSPPTSGARTSRSRYGRATASTSPPGTSLAERRGRDLVPDPAGEAAAGADARPARLRRAPARRPRLRREPGRPEPVRLGRREGHRRCRCLAWGRPTSTRAGSGASDSRSEAR